MKQIGKILLLTFNIYALLIFSPIKAQELEFAHLTTKNGLSNSDINSIVQDKDGFIWFATDYCLNRYDGYQIKIYRNIPGDSTSLQDNTINCLYIDHDGVLWIGTSHEGISKYVKEKDSFENFLNENNKYSISYNYVTHITEDDFNDLWISTLGGLNRFNRKTRKFQRFNEIDNKDKSKTVLSDNIRTLKADGKGNLLIGYERNGLGILHVKDLTFKNYPFPLSTLDYPVDNAINSILIRGKEYWFATRAMGVFIFNSETKQYSKLMDSNMDKRSNYLMADNNDSCIWISTKNGLYNYNVSTKHSVAYFNNDCNAYSLTNNSVTCTFKDNQGIIWVGCMQGGVNFARYKKQFTYYRKEVCNTNSLAQQSVSCILDDSKGNLWVGYFDNGVEIIDKKNQKHTFYFNIPTRNGKINTGSVFCFHEDKKGNIWIGTYSSGLFQYNSQSGEFINYQNNKGSKISLSGNDIRTIDEDQDGNIWIGIHGKGVDKFNVHEQSIENFRYGKANFGTSRASDWIYKIYVDRENNVWIGNVSGLAMLSNKATKFENFNHTLQGIRNESLDVIWTIAEDKSNHLWVGSSMGLSMFDIKTKKFLKLFTKNDGLPSDAIASIEVANDSSIWIGTYSGLVRFNQFQSKFKTYIQSNGLQSDRYFINTSFRNKNGEIFFGGINGIIKFHPDSMADYKFIPPVVLTDFKLFNISENKPNSTVLEKNISETKEIKLKYSQNVITIEYVALNYAESEKAQYAYMLTGFDRDWNFVGNKREATYTNLSPGHYTFKVKGTNSDGVWNEKGALLSITVLPPFWLSIWGFILYATIVLFAFYIYKRIIENREILKQKLVLEHMESEKQIEMNNIRLRFFTNISHEFRNSLSLIIGPAEYLKAQLPEVSKQQMKQVKLILENGQRLLRLINQLLDLRKIESGNFKLYPSPGNFIEFCKGVVDTFEFVAIQKNIKFTFEPTEDKIFAWFDFDKVEKIIYNLISNAFKYTDEGGTVKMKVSSCKHNSDIINAVCIEVSDSGLGISEDEISKIFEKFYQIDSPKYLSKGGTGIGLSLIKELVEMHNGSVEVKSKLRDNLSSESGTTFKIILPLDIKESIDGLEPLHANLKDSIEDNFPVDQNKNGKSNKKHKACLLVVDDNPELRKFVTDVLSDSYRVIESDNANDGLKLVLEFSPELIISDIMMPGMQGTEFCKTVKSDERTSHIPIILLTALNSIKDKVDGFNFGADDYITKPFNSEILKSRVNNILENRKRLSEKFKKHIIVEPKDITITSTDEKFLQKAMDVVEKHMDDSSFDVEVFIHELSVSRTLLHNKLKALTNLSATEFIKTLRIKRAARLLTEGKLTVSEVSVMVGFNSRNYFSKCFTEQFGVSPSEYEKSA